MNFNEIKLIENIMDANDQIASQNKARLDSHGIFALNIMASPGAGKTSFILQTIQQLQGTVKSGVIEGDTAPVTIDSDKIRSTQTPVV